LTFNRKVDKIKNWNINEKSKIFTFDEKVSKIFTFNETISKILRFFLMPKIFTLEEKI
jgi:hypothetical protein